MFNMNKIDNLPIFYNPEEHNHLKASERYIEVKMEYPEGRKFEGWIPIEYRRTGLDLRTKEEIESYLSSVYPLLDPIKYPEWKAEQDRFWNEEKSGATETRMVFEAFCSGEWVCVNCAVDNPNWARRFQDLKEMGYTFATQTPVNCPVCNKRSTYVMCIHLPRFHNVDGNGYETWSNQLRKRILSVLGNYDAYEAKVNTNLLPDHKFSEIRWDDKTKSVNPDDMTDEEIKEKFQLISNQRNQQKREVCRLCFQTKERPSIFGINFFYSGGKRWDDSIPEKGKDAEQGCVGCPWYDIEKWRKEFQKTINDFVAYVEELNKKNGN